MRVTNKTRKVVATMACRGRTYGEIASIFRDRASVARTGRSLAILVEIASFAESCERDWGNW